MKEKNNEILEKIYLHSYKKMINGLRAEFLENVKLCNDTGSANLPMNDAKEFFTVRIKRTVDTTQLKTPVLMKYILKNSGQVAFKNLTALNTIKLLLTDNPQTTLMELDKMFHSKVSQLRHLFKEADKVTEKEKKHPRRYFCKEEEILRTGDGKTIALTTQWGNNFSSFIQLAGKYGYKIELHN